MTLDDKYTRLGGLVYLTGIQALVRLPMDQVRRDRAANLRTGVFISGYEGSPLSGVSGQTRLCQPDRGCKCGPFICCSTR